MALPLLHYGCNHHFKQPADGIVAAYGTIMKLIVRERLPVVARMVNFKSDREEGSGGKAT